MKTIYRVAAAMSLCVSTMASAVDLGPLNPLVTPVTGPVSGIASQLIVSYVPTGTALLASLANNPLTELGNQSVAQGVASLPGLPNLPVLNGIPLLH